MWEWGQNFGLEGEQDKECGISSEQVQSGGLCGMHERKWDHGRWKNGKEDFGNFGKNGKKEFGPGRFLGLGDIGRNPQFWGGICG